MFKKVDVKSIIKVLKADTNVSALTTTIKWGNPLKEPSVDYVVVQDDSPMLISDSVENKARISVRIISGNSKTTEGTMSDIENAIRNVLLNTFTYDTFEIIRIYPVSSSPTLLRSDNRKERVTNYEFNFIN